MASATNVKLGHCQVVFNNQDLGFTKGGVEVSYEPEYHDVMVDNYGNSLVDQILIGEKLTAKVPLAEYILTNLKVAIPQGTYAGSGNIRVTIGNAPGQKSLDDAATLVLHPVDMGSSLAFDVVFYKAIVTSTVLLSHTIDGEKIIEVTFQALIDETKSAGNRLGLIGNST